MRNIRFHILLVAATSVLVSAAGYGTAGPICFEAEAANKLTDPMQVTTEQDASEKEKTIISEASGKAYLAIPQGVGKPPKVKGDARITFEVPKDDTYYLWCRVWWNDECGNSVSISIDDSRPFSFGQDTTYKSWHWVKSPPRIKQLELSAGRHTLVIANREDGVRIDQVLLVSSKRYVPVGIEPVTYTPEQDDE